MGRLTSFFRPLAVCLALGLTAVGMVSADGIWLLCMGGIMVSLLYLFGSLVPPPASGRRGSDVTGEERVGRSVQLLSGFLLSGFLVLTLNLLRTQVVQAETIAATQVVTVVSPTGAGQYDAQTQVIRGSAVTTYDSTISGDNVTTGTLVLQNPRILGRELRVQRGFIYDAAGGVIAGRQVYSDTGYVQRTYPQNDIGYLVGYYNPTIYGITGIEQTYDNYLAGRAGTPDFVTQQNELLHRPVTGQDVYLTIDPKLQQEAQEALGERRGAVVLLDSRSGAVLAMASYPHFDPEGLAFNPEADDWGIENQRLVDYWQSITTDAPAGDVPLLNRATQAVYPPGSTFKTVTLAAGLDTGKVQPTTVFTDPGFINIDSHDHVDCSTCRPAGHTSNIFTLMEGYQWSLNVVFAELAVRDLGANVMQKYADAFGFDRNYDMGIPVVTSLLGPSDFLNNPNGLAATSYGQGDVQATPLTMALVAAAVGRGGDLPAPYIVDKVVNPVTGGVLVQTKPNSLGRTVSPETGTTLRQMMYTSVEKGWANGAAVPGFAVGGKTGTAETGKGTQHAWFIGIAGQDANNPQYAIAVVLEEGGEGSRVAVPVAKQVLEAALKR